MTDFIYVMQSYVLNFQVKGLAEVLDIDLQPLRQHSDRVTALCDQIQNKLCS